MDSRLPQTMGIASLTGHWTSRKLLARGRGMPFDTVVDCDPEQVDPVSLNIKTRARVRIGKVKSQERRRSVDKRHVPGALRVLIGFLLLCLASACWAEARGETEAPLGKIEHMKGEVLVQRRNGLELRGEPGMALYPGDQITTGKLAEVQFVLPPGKQFRLGPEAQVSIDELSSSEGEDQQPVMRLVLGYLWSKIEKLRGRKAAFDLHTPTAVMGVRGTEFETVVSLDAASLVSVDEGRVELDADGETVIVEQGKMSEVEFDGKPSLPSPTVSKEMRDWQAWREKRVEGMMNNLPRIAPGLRHRFEQSALRAGKFAESVQEKGEGIRETMKEVRVAKQERDRPKVRVSARRLRDQAEEFRKTAARFRQGFNRFQTMSRLSIRLDLFVRENQARFPERQLAFIQAQFASIAEKREEVKELQGRSISTIREVFRQLKAFREEMVSPRDASGSTTSRFESRQSGGGDVLDLLTFSTCRG